MGWEASNVFQVLIITSSGSGQGLFVYTGPPGANNLSFSVTAANGTDPFGNVTVAGATAYKLDAGTGHWWAISENTGTLNWYSGTTNNQTTTVYSLQSSISGTGSPDLLLGAGAGGTVRTQGPFAVPSGGASVLGGLTADTEAISSGQAAGLLQTVTNTTSGATGSLVRWIVNAAGDVLLGCRVAGDTQNRITVTVTAGGLPQFSFGPGGSTAPDTFVNRNASGDLVINPLRFAQVQAALALNNVAAPTALAGSTQVFSDSSGKLAQQPPAGTVMQVPGAALATFPGNTVTSASLVNLGNATIPANDAEVGSVYELEIEGNGTQATTTAVSLTLGAAIGGTGGIQQVIGAGYAPSGGTFRYWARVRAYCVTSGAAATWRLSIRAEVCQNATPGAVVINDSSATATITKDSTVNQVLALQAAQGAITNTPTIINREQVFKRVA